MKHQIKETVEVPQGISFHYKDNTLFFKKDNLEIARRIKFPSISILVEGNKINFVSKKGNKNQFKIISSYVAHLKNIFRGLEDKFVYKLEAVNVHFPMTLKVENEKLVINNFLGEKVPRYAEIANGVDVSLKGNQITVSSHDKEAAGRTAANIERSTKIRSRDRRVFQDGIYITQKPRE